MSQQKFCRDKHYKTRLLSRQTTKIILVTTPANDTEEGALPSAPELAYRETEFTSSLKVGTVSHANAGFYR